MYERTRDKRRRDDEDFYCLIAAAAAERRVQFIAIPRADQRESHDEIARRFAKLPPIAAKSSFIFEKKKKHAGWKSLGNRCGIAQHTIMNSELCVTIAFFDTNTCLLEVCE